MGVLVTLCIFGLFLGNLQNSSRANQRVDRVDAAVRTLVQPLAVPLSGITRGTADFFSGLFRARQLAAENRHLKELELPLALYMEVIEQKNQEIDRLRKAQGFGPIPGKKRIPASVSGSSISENRLTLNVGSNQGVKLGAPVESSNGLVGTVEEVESNECQVLMLTSAGLQMTSRGKTQLIGAIDVSRNPQVDGLVRGENATTLSMTFWNPKAPVQIGDLIMTSGYSDKIPRGVIIGKIIQVEPNEEFGTLKARIDPAISTSTLDVVYVLV